MTLTSRDIAWQNLSMRERNILEHLFGIWTEGPQTLVISADAPVRIRRPDGKGGHSDHILQVAQPSRDELHRMRDFCAAHPQEIAILESTPDHLIVRGITM